ncbi:hypothetical protein BHE74_00015345 [Ensete ventricosum]|nr:hypothetical protein BHE74_00015345 [Ensete ventricosum]
MWQFRSFLRTASLVCRSTSWSYVGHVVAIVPDMSPTAYRRWCRTLVGCCVCLGAPPVANYQGSGGTVRWLATVSTLTRRMLPIAMGQGVLFVVDRRAVRGYPEVGSGGGRMLDVVEMGTLCSSPHLLRPAVAEGHRWGVLQLMVTEGCVSNTTGSMMAEGCALGTTELMTVEERVSSATELMMTERHVSGTIELTMAERCVTGTIELKMAEGHD